MISWSIYKSPNNFLCLGFANGITLADKEGHSGCKLRNKVSIEGGSSPPGEQDKSAEILSRERSEFAWIK